MGNGFAVSWPYRRQEYADQGGETCHTTFQRELGLGYVYAAVCLNAPPAPDWGGLDRRSVEGDICVERGAYAL